MSTRDLFDQAYSQPDDANARLRAIDPRRSFIVQAPAGSGKTELLTQRYLALLAKVDSPEEVLAITFTRKATGEMRERIATALEAGEGARPMAPHESRTYDLVQAVLARDKTKGWQLKEHPSRLRILTIDALCQSLARQMPMQADFVGEADTIDDATLLYREAARELLELHHDKGPHGEAVARMLAHLDNDIERFESMVVAMLGRRDHWLDFMFAGQRDMRAMRAEQEAVLKAVITSELEALRECVPPHMVDAIVTLAGAAGESLAGADNGVEPLAPGAYCAGLRAMPGCDADDVNLWSGIANVLLTGAGKWRKRAPGKLPKQLGDEAKALLLALDDAEHEAFRERLWRVKDVPSARYSDAQWQVLEVMVDVLRAAAALLRVVFARRSQVDFIEVVSAARHALGEDQAPSELALSLDHRISHILVDEFQDTSFSHRDLLGLLTAGWEPQDGRTLFVVGDPMQSIYRFREADVGVFLRTWEHGFADLTLERVTLTTNFRSQAGLVSWVNRIFPHVFAERHDATVGAVCFSPSIAHRDAGAGGVFLHPVHDEGAIDEAHEVARIASECLREDEHQSIAILVRSRAHLSELLPALRLAGVAYRGVDIEPLSGVTVVQDLLAILRVLLHPEDRVAWLSVLRAPWCGLGLADLLKIASMQAANEPLYPLLQADTAIPGLSEDGAMRARRVFDVLAAAAAERARKSARGAVEGVWLALGGPSCMPKEQLKSARAFFELLDSFAQRGSIDSDEFAARIDEVFAASDTGVHGVEIMTMHKSKGLEFDTVLLPGLGRTSRAEEKSMLAWTRVSLNDGEPGLLMAPVPALDGDETLTYAYLRRLESAKGRHETARLIYVAATRARRALHLLCTVKENKDGDLQTPRPESLLAHIWAPTSSEFARTYAQRSVSTSSQPASTAKLAATQDDALRHGVLSVPADWSPNLKADPLDCGPKVDHDAQEALEFEWVRPAARHIGTVVHRVLQLMSDAERTPLASARDAHRRKFAVMLRSLGVPAAELDGAVARVEQALDEIEADPRGRWLLDPKHQEAESEYALSARVGSRVRYVVMDRTFVDADNVRWVVDYKTGRHEGGDLETFLDTEQVRYREQLEGYAQVLVSAGEQRPIKLGLYFPTLKAWREWDYAARS